MAINIAVTRNIGRMKDATQVLIWVSVNASNDCIRSADQLRNTAVQLQDVFHECLHQPRAGHEGLDGLLDEAYLAHRLVEEVNDLYIKHFGQPLIPADTTVANVIAHQLIGEAFANQLDKAVHHAVDEMLNEDSFALESVEAYREQLKSPDTEAAWKRWPCLSRQLGVELALDQPA
jgi:hypothetical protein